MSRLFQAAPAGQFRTLQTDQITRIPEGAVLTVVGAAVPAFGSLNVKWFEVIYPDQRGWIRIDDTDKA